MSNETMGCSQQNPRCRKLYRTNEPVPPMNKLQGKKRWISLLEFQIKHNGWVLAGF